MTASPRRLAALLVAGILMVLATGCTTYSAKLKDLRPEIAAGAYDEALARMHGDAGFSFHLPDQIRYKIRDIFSLIGFIEAAGIAAQNF